MGVLSAGVTVIPLERLERRKLNRKLSKSLLFDVFVRLKHKGIHMRSIKMTMVLILWLSLTTVYTLGQSTTTSVPDLSGFNVPQAESILHLAGLRLGVQTVVFDNSVAIDQLGTIVNQSVGAGDRVELGQVIDISIVHAPNVRFIYDDNDLTLINQTGRVIPLDVFTLGGNGTSPLILEGNRWGISAIPAGGCIQIWSIGRAAPKQVEGCSDITAWFSSANNPDLHVWTQVRDMTSFDVILDGVVWMTCPAAPPASQDSPTVCDVYLPTSPAPEQGGFLYLTYTNDVFSALNPSTDTWMPLTAPLTTSMGDVVRLNEPSVYSQTLPIVLTSDGSLLPRLAPGECLLLYSEDEIDATAPEPCGLIVAEGQADLFWRDDFRVTGSDGVSRVCKGASPDKLTVCIMQQ